MGSVTRRVTIVAFAAVPFLLVGTYLARSGRPAQPTATPPGAEQAVKASVDWGRLPLSFERNMGQHDVRARFVARSGGGAVFLMTTGARFALAGSAPRLPAVPGPSEVSGRAQGATIPPAWFELTFPGGKAVEPVAERELPGKVNYFVGNRPAAWRTGVPTYERVRYRGVQPGVDVVFYGDGTQVEYDFELAPGADPALSRVAFGHVEGLRVDDAGDLRIVVGGREVVQRRPRVLQWIEGRRVDVGAAYVLEGNEVAIALGPSDRAAPLVIDPAIVYSTFLGGTNSGEGRAVAVDASGSAYVVGYTQSTDFPMAYPLWPGYGGGIFDGFVTRFAPDGRSVLFSTYLGGNGFDDVANVAVHSTGVYIVGSTNSTNFPISAAPLQSAIAGGLDGFVLKLSADGGSLLFSTFLGGSADESLMGVAVDAGGNAFVAGSTTSTDFPTAGPYQAAKAGISTKYDAVVLKLPAAGKPLTYSTYLGGTGSDSGSAIVIDVSGNAYVTGSTESNDFPLLGAFQGVYGGGTRDGFVTKLNAAGNALVYSSYLGGSGYDAPVRVMALDGSGCVWVAGQTDSTNFPTVSPAQAFGGGTYDAFVSRVAANGGSLLFSTWLGGSGDETAFAVSANGTGAVVLGTTGSWDFPVVRPVQGAFGGGGTDLFLTRYPTTGGAPDYSTFLGGSAGESAQGLALDASGNAFAIGSSRSPAFPVTAGAYQTALAGGSDAILVKLSPLTLLSVSPASGFAAGGTSVTLSGSAFQAGSTVQFGGVAATGVTVGSATSITAAAPPHAAGTVDVAVTAPDGATSTLPSAFTFVPAPTVTGASPTGGAPAGGTAVTVSGTGFAAGASVGFGGVAATDVTVVSATSITATAPAHAAGAVDVVVSNADTQSGTLPGGFLYAPAPTISSVTASGPTAGGTVVTVSGTGFLVGAAVSFGGTAAPGVTVVDALTIQATTPPHAAGAVDVVVTNPTSQSATLPSGFTYVPPPTVASVSPTHGPATLGQAVTVTGADFLGTVSVSFGGDPASGVTLSGSTSISATAPIHGAGTVDVTVTNADGQSHSLTSGFTYDPPPAISSIAPTSGPEAGGGTVILTGANFAAGASVRFGGVEAAGVSVASATSITAVAPPHAAGAVDVVVVNPDGQTGTSAGGFRYVGSGRGEGSKSAYGCSSSGGSSASLLLFGLASLLLARTRRRAGRALLALAVALPLAAQAAPRETKTRVAVMPIKAGLGVDAGLAALVTDSLVAELADRGLQTITSKDVESALGFERQKTMLGCGDESCLAEIAGALGADRVVSGDIAQVRELTVFSVQVFNTKNGTVEKRFHERMSGGDAADLLDATERAGAELFPGTTKTGTASRRRSVRTSTARPLALVARGGYDVKEPGGFGVVGLEYRLSRSVRLGLGGLGTGAQTYGAAVRAGWYPLSFERLSVYGAAEAHVIFASDLLVAANVALGMEWAFSERLAVSLEVPLTLMASAPAEYETTYFMPGASASWRF